MPDPKLYQYQDKFVECSKEYKSLDRKLKRLYQSLEEIRARVEAVESEFSNIF